jgi:hypothetical protein
VISRQSPCIHKFKVFALAARARNCARLDRGLGHGVRTAQLLIRQVTTGGAAGSPELVLDLYSVRIGGKQYRVVTSNVDESSRRGMGKNRRTAEFLGGGAAIGALMGGVFGGGRGAGIGALSGATRAAIAARVSRDFLRTCAVKA